MKRSGFLISIVVAVALVICTAMISSAVKSVGRSIERAAQHQQRGRIPQRFTVRTPDLSALTIRVTNFPGGDSFRLETVGPKK